MEHYNNPRKGTDVFPRTAAVMEEHGYSRETIEAVCRLSLREVIRLYLMDSPAPEKPERDLSS